MIYKVLIGILILAVITAILMYICCIAGGESDDKSEYIMDKKFGRDNEKDKNK